MTEKQKICQICHEEFKNDDDVVVCPDCGAAYHRGCYEKLSKCVYEDAHGTDLQFNPKDEVNNTGEENINDVFIQVADENADNARCANCGHDFEGDEKFCPYCRTPRGTSFNPAQIFEAFSGFEDNIEKDGVKAADIKAFTLANSRRYLNKFFNLGKGKRLSWNWAAFLVPEGWFFYRKMYSVGFAAMILKIIANACALPIFNMIANEEAASFTDYSSVFADAIARSDKTTLIFTAAAVVLTVIISLLAGLFGDAIYCEHIKNKVLNIDNIENPELDGMPRNLKLGRIGGINPLMFMVGFWAVQFAPDILVYFIK